MGDYLQSEYERLKKSRDKAHTDAIKKAEEDYQRRVRGEKKEQSWWEKAKEAGLSILDILTDRDKTLLEKLLEAAGVGWDFVTDTGETIVDNTLDTLQTLIAPLLQLIDTLLEKYDQLKETITHEIKQQIANLIPWIELEQQTLVADFDEWWETELAELSETFSWIFEFRDSITEFFSDPLQWLYNKMDEWFERFW